MNKKEQEMFNKEWEDFHPNAELWKLIPKGVKDKIKQYISKHYILREDLLGGLEGMKMFIKGSNVGVNHLIETHNDAIERVKTFINKQE